ncbi:MAG: tRNA (adenosine(37)-N6)-dimethylallyltransferase MiaA [Planctomycetota bacterium]
MPPSPSPLDAAPLFFLIGETAVGKTALALEVAERAGAEIVSLDAMLVYRGMDVGTAKPTAADRARVAHHALDLVDPPVSYDAPAYLADAGRALAAIHARGRRALFVGGTAFYLRALVHGLFAGPDPDPALRAALVARARAEGGAALHAELAAVDPRAAARIHPHDEKRLVRALEVLAQTGRPISAWQREWGWDGGEAAGRPRTIVGIFRDPRTLEARIRGRTRAMLERGWVEEARAIRDGVGFGPTSIQALGYREVLALADGAASQAETEERIVRRTRQLARRQRTAFRSFAGTRWVDLDAPDAAGRALAALGW